MGHKSLKTGKMKKITLILFLQSILFWSALAQSHFPKLHKSNVNIMVANDMGNRGVWEQKNVAELMGRFAEQNRIDFFAVAGDPIHDDGVKSVDDEEWMLKIEDIYTAQSLHATPWYVVSGNHEYNGSVQAIIDYSQKSERWNAPARYFTVSKKIKNRNNLCLFVFIDTTPFIGRYQTRGDAGEQDTAEQLKWIETELSSSTAKWKIVIGHHPIHAGTDKSESERTDMQSSVGVLLEKCGADIFISGHIHNFQHLRPAGTKVHYVVNSSASQSRPVEKIDDILFSNSDPGFTVLSMNKKTCEFFFINHKGECVYSYTILRKKR